MKQFMRLILAGVLVAITGCSSSSSGGGGGATSNADKIVGIWIIAKFEGKEPPKDAKEATMEFTKDGKVKSPKEDDATYKVDGDKLTVTSKGEKGKSETMTIKKLDADALVIYNEEHKGELELKRKK